MQIYQRFLPHQTQSLAISDQRDDEVKTNPPKLLNSPSDSPKTIAFFVQFYRLKFDFFEGIFRENL